MSHELAEAIRQSTELLINQCEQLARMNEQLVLMMDAMKKLDERKSE
jgi:hypothetical protein